MATKQASVGRRARQTRWQRRGAFAWMAIVGAFALWATLSYRSFAEMIGEWEYRHFGVHLPIITLAFLTFLFSLPALAFLWIRGRDRRRRRVDTPVGDVVALAMRAERRLLALLFWISGLAALAAVLVLAWTLTLPHGRGPVRLVSAGITAPAEGLTRFTGQIIYIRTATFRQNLFLSHRAVRFAPVEPGERAGLTRYFVELSNRRLEEIGIAGQPASYTGILKRDALPGAIVHLFEYAGFEVARPHYVLFASRASMLYPYYLTAANWLIGSLFILLLALFQRWRMRRIVQRHPHLGTGSGRVGSTSAP